MSTWEHKYRESVAGITSPGTLDEKILQQARQFKPQKTEKRWVSGVASGCTAMAIVVLLAHPAQYLGALTPNLQRSSGQLQESTPVTVVEQWYQFRVQAKAGNFVELCGQWRRQQWSSVAEKLPRDLEQEARTHCRLLP